MILIVAAIAAALYLPGKMLQAGNSNGGTTSSYDASSSTISSQLSTVRASSSLQSIQSLEDGSAVCVSIGELPDPSCTPGATNSNVTQGNIDSTICVSGWTSTVRPSESYTENLKYKSIAEYGYNDSYVGDYEEDHLIPLEVGGSPTSVYNLWAEPHYGNYTSYDKDALENYLNAQVCDGKMPLVQAQQDIATNWVKYWELYVNGSSSSNGD